MVRHARVRALIAATGNRTLGSITSLPLVRETTNSAGQTVRRVRDTLGNVLEYTLGAGGAISNVRVVERARN